MQVVFLWLLTLVRMPRRMAAVAAALLLASSIGLVVFLHTEPGSVVGEVRQLTPIGGGSIFARIQFPLQERALPVILTEELVSNAGLASGDWALAFGEVRPVDGRPMFVARTVASFRTAIPSWFAGAGDWQRLRELPLAAVLIGCAALLAGCLIASVAAAVLFAAAGAALAWHGAMAASALSWIALPAMGIHPIALTGALVGLVVGWRSALGSLWERGAAASVLFLFLDPIAETFLLPDFVALALPILALAHPVTAYALLGALFLTAGLSARDEAVWAILAASAASAVLVRLSLAAGDGRRRWA